MKKIFLSVTLALVTLGLTTTAINGLLAENQLTDLNAASNIVAVESEAKSLQADSEELVEVTKPIEVINEVPVVEVEFQKYTKTVEGFLLPADGEGTYTHKLSTNNMNIKVGKTYEDWMYRKVKVEIEYTSENTFVLKSIEKVTTDEHYYGDFYCC